jgi:hypothetical protein
MFRLFLVTLIVVLGVYAGLSLQVSAAPQLQATMQFYYADWLPQNDPAAEPLFPTSVNTSLKGCGFVPSQPVTITDEVTIWPIFSWLPFDESKRGLFFQVIDVIPADAAGCVYSWYEAWGIGNHAFHAYQYVKNNNKLMEVAYQRVLVSPMHPEDTGTCLEYMLPPAPGPFRDTFESPFYLCP